MRSKRLFFQLHQGARLLIVCFILIGISGTVHGEIGWDVDRLMTNQRSPLTTSLKAFNGKLYCVQKANSTNKIVVVNSSDGITWNSASAYYIPNGQTTVSPALEVFNNRLYCMAKGENDNYVYVTSTGDGSSWSAWSKINGPLTDTGTALAAFNGKLYCVNKGLGNTEMWMFSTSDGTIWSGNHQIPNFYSPATAALRVYNNKLHCVVKGTDNKLYSFWTSDGANWSAAYKIQNQVTAEAPALGILDGKLQCLWKANDGSDRLYYSNSSDGQNWSSPLQIPGQKAALGVALGEFGTKLYCAYKSTNGTNDIFLTDARVGTLVILPMTLYAQQTNMWCWAASGEMIMTYLGVNGDISQCTQANNYNNRADCCNNFQNCVLGGWPEFDRYGCNYDKTFQGTALTFAQLKTEFQNNRPVGFAWGWLSGGGHYMTARGVYVDDVGNQYVYILDPSPWNVDKNNGGSARLISYFEFVRVPGAYSTWGNDYNIIKQ
jgi:hypothetical protein